MCQNMTANRQRDRKDTDRQDCVGGKGSDFSRANHGGDNGNAHDQGQMQQAPAMSVMVGEMMMMVSAMSAPAMAMTAPALVLVFLLLAFVERKFLAHADIQFTHVIPYVSYGPIGRSESIIIESSNIKLTWLRLSSLHTRKSTKQL